MNNESSERLFCSSLREDAWHPPSGGDSYQSWHFDALSDDGSEAVVVSFHDNFILSPSYHAMRRGKERVRLPAVKFNYFAGGRPVISCVCEGKQGSFISAGPHECSIDRSGFRLATADYGVGFVVTLDLPLRNGRRAKAELEWLQVESDVSGPPPADQTRRVWNAAVPRADVTGRIEITGRDGRVRSVHHFRGTGYHDSVRSGEVEVEDLSSRMWGRAHFSDATVIFERHGGTKDHAAPGMFVVLRDGEMHEHDAECLASEHRRHQWGLNIPGRMSYIASDGTRLRIRPRRSIASDVCETKMLSDIDLFDADGKHRHTIGLTEFIDPGRMHSRVFRLLADLKTARNGKASWF